MPQDTLEELTSAMDGTSISTPSGEPSAIPSIQPSAVPTTAANMLGEVHAPHAAHHVFDGNS